MYTDKLNLDSILNEDNPDSPEIVINNEIHPTIINAKDSDEFLPMSNHINGKNNKINQKLVNSNKKKDIFAFGSEEPMLLSRYGHLLGFRKYLNLRKELQSPFTHYAFPKSNPFVKDYTFYENMGCKFNYANDDIPVIEMLKLINPTFLNEITDMVSIAFELSNKENDESSIRRRDNSIKVVVMLAMVNTCNKVNVHDVFAVEATQNAPFLIVFNAICELIDLIRNQVTYAT